MTKVRHSLCGAFIGLLLSLGSITTQANAGVPTLSCTPPADAPEIVDLARGLNYDLNNIYKYVYYEIEITPTFGSKKGALGTLLDRRGTNIDQNVLFVALLRQSCIPANFKYGQITYTGDQYASMFGVKNNYPSLIGMLSNGGFAATTTGDEQTSLTTVTVNTVWTELTTGGQTIDLDPSFKSHNIYAPIDIAAVTGHTQTSFMDAALVGSAQVAGMPAGTNSIQNVNRAQITGLLNQYSEKLTNYIKASKPSASAKQVFGGVVITDDYFGLSYSTGSGTVYATLPATFETVYTVTVSNNATGASPTISQILYGSQISGKRLTLTYNANKPILMLDGTVLATGAAATGTTQTVSLSVSNPYPSTAGAAQTTTVRPTVKVGGNFAVILTSGPVGRDTQSRHQRLIAKNKQAGMADSSEPVIGESLAALGTAYVAQVERAFEIANPIFNAQLVQHNTMGIAGAIPAPYVDFPGDLVSINAGDGSTTDQQFLADTFAQGIFASSLESTTVSQLQGDDAVSTVRVFDLANNAGSGFVDTTASSWPSVKLKLTSWPASELADVTSFYSSYPNGHVIVPVNGGVIDQQWKGTGYEEINTTSDGATFGYKISGGYSGGYNCCDVSMNNSYTSSSDFEQSYSSFDSMSGEPIDLRTGDYYYTNEDMNVGSSPAQKLPVNASPVETASNQSAFTLALKRTYNSAGRLQKGPLGYGWTHNFQTSVTTDSDSYEGFGDREALYAAPTMVGLYVMKDLLTTPTGTMPLNNSVVSTLIASWMMDQLVNNAVTIAVGGQTQKFMKIPTADGTGVYLAPPGDASKLTHNADGSFTLKDKQGNFSQFSSDGVMTSWTDVNNNTLAYNYTGSGASKVLTSVTNGLGRTLTFTYSTSSQLTAVSDGTRSVHYTYDGAGNLATFADSAATPEVTTYSYDQPGRMTKVFNPSFPTIASVTNIYDDQGQVRTQADAFGHVWTYEFANGEQTQEFDPTEAMHALTYDDLGNTLTDTDATGVATNKIYDGLSRVASETPTSGVTVSYGYDLENNMLTRSTAPKAGIPDPVTGQPANPIVERWTYDPVFNKPLTYQDGNGYITYYTYDAVGNLLTIVQPVVAKAGGTTAWPTTIYTYGAHGLPASVIDAEGRVTTYAYNVLFDHTKDIVDAGSGHLNLTTSRVYDTTGNLTNLTDPNGNTTVTSYDKMRRPTVVIQPGSLGTTTYTYDLDGRQTAVKQATGNSATPWRTTATTYTASGKKQSVTESDGNTTTYIYDAVDRVLAETRNSGRQVTYGYDAASRQTSITDGVSGSLDPSITINRGPVRRQSMTYDDSGQVATLTDANGHILSYYYDEFGRLEAIQYPDNSVEIYGYDADNNKTVTQTRSVGDVFLYYDALNRLTRKSVTGESTITYGYDLTGRVVQLKSADDSAPYTYGYDSAGRNVGESRPDIGGTVSWTLDADGNRTSLTWPESGALAYQTTNVYDQLNRLTDIYEGAGTTGQRLAHYTYDKLSQRSTAAFGGDSSVPAASTAYTYNSVGQVSLISDTWNGSALSLSYTYNADHQRTSETASDGDFLPSGLTPTVWSYVTNLLNQFTSAGPQSFAYDGNGNLTSNGAWAYYYDTENHLLAAGDGSTAAIYTYDVQGRRKSKNVNGIVTNYLSVATPTVGSQGVVPENTNVSSQEIAEYDGSGNLLRRYVYGPNLDEPMVTVDAAGNRSYHFTDASGSVIALADATGAVTEKHTYGAYGLSTTATGSAFQYAGRRIDAETGLYYNRARYYSASLGRFLQTDPIGTQGGINLYAYTGNDPLNHSDPLGTSCDSNSSQYENITGSGALETNIGTDVTRSSFEDNLQSSGWAGSTSSNGNTTFTNSWNNSSYYVRDNATSTGGSTADFRLDGTGGSADIKIRLGYY